MHLVDFLVSLSVVCALYWLAGPKSRLPLPPSPKGFPVVGNAFSIPKSFEWLTYHKWSVELGTDILYLNVLGQSVIVLDKEGVANDLLEKNSAVYSSRPRFSYIQDVIGVDYHTAWLKYGQIWRRHRRLIHPFFNASASSNYNPHVLGATRRLMGRLLEKPRDIKTELHYTAGDAIMSVCYGVDVRTEEGAHYFETVKKGAYALFDAVIPGKFLVDFFPSLKHVPEWLPGAGFKRDARLVRKYVDDMITLPFKATKKRMASGCGVPCFVTAALDYSVGLEVATHSDLVRDAAGALYTGKSGSDTTVGTMASCVIGLLSRPDVLKRAPDDLDRVIQPGRLPEFEDQSSLPYITAIAKEALRWRDVTPLGVPHYVEEDQEYCGYRIPAGSIIMGNSWALLHDENIYPDPFSFKPERFMKGDAFDYDAKDPEHACWGFGRRICSGRHMAFASIWITIASLIYAFDIEKEVDENGRILEADPPYRSSVVVTPDVFPCRINVRSDELAHLIRAGIQKETQSQE